MSGKARKKKQSTGTARHDYLKEDIVFSTPIDKSPSKKLMTEDQWRIFCETPIGARQVLVKQVFKL